MENGRIVRASADGTGSVTPLFQKTWDGGGDGTTWGNAANWRGDVVPSTGDKVIIPNNINVIIDSPSETAFDIQLGQNSTLTINVGASLAVSGSCRNGIKLLEGATLNINGDLTVELTDDDGIDLTTNSTMNISATGTITMNFIGEDGIDLNGGTVVHQGTATIQNIAESGISLFGLANSSASFTNQGTINTSNTINENGIDLRGANFQNYGIVTISNTNNDGIHLEETEVGSSFINYPSGSITLQNLGDEGIDILTGSNSFENIGSLSINTAGDKGIQAETGASFTNDCTIDITEVNFGIDILSNGTMLNRSTINVGLAVAATSNIAIGVMGTFNNHVCAICNVTTDDEIITAPAGIINNDGVITSIATIVNNNNGAFNNNGEIRPVTFMNAGNAINGTAPQAGAVPATSRLSTTVTCSSCTFFTVPTLSEWGLIILALLIMTIGVLFVSVPKFITNEGAQINVPITQRIPFSTKAYLKNWTISLVSILALFTIAIQFFGYELTNADPFGAMASSFLIGYLLFLLGRK